MTIAELKEGFKENNCLVTNTKQVLVERLAGILQAPAGEPRSMDDDGHVFVEVTDCDAIA